MDKVKITDSVRLRRGVNITTLPLGALDGFILSRVEGSTRVKDIVAGTGQAESTVLDALQNLIALNVIHVDHNRSGEVDEEEAALESLGPPATLTEEQKVEVVDVAPDQRLKILQVGWYLKHGNHYDVLGIKRGASEQDLKRAYYERSREFHPDAFFRKQLGSYKPLLDALFKGVKKAHDVLSDAAKRAEYDQSLPKDAVRAAPAAPTPEWKLDPRRAEEAEARRLKANPMVQRVERARRHVARTKELVASKQWTAAHNEILLASALDPRDKEIPPLVEQVNRELRREKFTKQLARVEYMCTLGEPQEEVLAPLLKDVLEAAPPEDVPTFLRLGRFLLRAKLPRLARQPLDRALRASPDQPDALQMLVDITLEAGLAMNALRYLERLAQVAPTPERLAKLDELKKARKE